MFEASVTNLLTNILGNYVKEKCFRPDRLSVGVWSGYVKLQHLELKTDIFSSSSHRIKLDGGWIGGMEIKIPWNRILVDSVVITLDEVYVLLETTGQVTDESILQQTKLALLEQLYKQLRHPVKVEGEDGFTSRVTNTIIDNLEFHVRNVHVLLEDKISGDHPFTTGLTVESIHVQSTDAEWAPVFVKERGSLIYKNIELNHMAVYLNPMLPKKSSREMSFEQVAALFRPWIAKRGSPLPSQYHYVLKPVDASARLRINKEEDDASMPQYELDVNVDTVTLQMEESQYCDILYLVASLTSSPLVGKAYGALRPGMSVLVDPAAWWKYAISAVKQDVRKRRSTWSWEFMHQRMLDRRAYVDLWKRKRLVEAGVVEIESSLAVEPLTTVDVETFDAIERRRSVDDLMFFRHLADAQVSKYIVAQKAIGSSESSAADQSSSSTWSWLFGSNVSESNKGLEKEEIAELYKSLGYDPDLEKSSSNTEFERKLSNAVHSRLHFTFHQGSISLRNDSDVKNIKSRCLKDPSLSFNTLYDPSTFIEGEFEKLQFAFQNRSDASSIFDLSLLSIQVYDKRQRLLGPKLRLEEHHWDNSERRRSRLFMMSYETMPKHVKADAALTLEMQPLEIIYSPTAICWTRLNEFMSIAEDLWEENEIAALNEMVSLKARTEAKLEYVMAHRIALSIELHIQAPVIIIPFTDKTDCAKLVIDLGCVDFITERLSQVDPDTIDSEGKAVSSGIQGGGSRSALQLLQGEEHDDFYDKFHLCCSKMQVMICPESMGDIWRSTSISDEHKSVNLLERFDINVDILASIIPLDPALNRFYIHGDLPALKFLLSMDKVEHLLLLAEKFSSPEQPIPDSIPLGDWGKGEEVDNDDLSSDDTWFSVTQYEPEDVRSRLFDLENELIKVTKERNVVEQKLKELKHRMTLEVEEEEGEDDSLLQYYAVDMANFDSKLTSIETELNELRLYASLDTNQNSLADSWVARWYPSQSQNPISARPQLSQARRIHTRKNVDCGIATLTFTIPLVSLDFSKADSDEYLSFFLRGLNLRVDQRSFSTSVHTKLKSFKIADGVSPNIHHHTGKQSQCMALSNSVAPYTMEVCLAKDNNSLSHSVKELIALSYTNREDEALITLDIHQLHIHFDQKVMTSLLRLLDEFKNEDEDIAADEEDIPTLSLPPASVSSRRKMSWNSSVSSYYPKLDNLTASVQADLERARQGLKQRKKKKLFKVELRLDTLSLSLGVGVSESINYFTTAPSRSVASIAFVGAQLDVNYNPLEGAKITGNLADVTLYDLRSEQDDVIGRDGGGVKVFGLQGQSTLSSLLQIEATPYNGCLSISIQSVKFIMCSSFLKYLQNYIMHGEVAKYYGTSAKLPTPPESTPYFDAIGKQDDAVDSIEEYEGSSGSASNMQLKLELLNPLIVIPKNDSSFSEEDGAILDLGKIQIGMDIVSIEEGQWYAKRIQMVVMAMNARFLNSPLMMLHDVDLELLVLLPQVEQYEDVGSHALEDNLIVQTSLLPSHEDLSYSTPYFSMEVQPVIISLMAGQVSSAVSIWEENLKQLVSESTSSQDVKQTDSSQMHIKIGCSSLMVEMVSFDDTSRAGELLPLLATVSVSQISFDYYENPANEQEERRRCSFQVGAISVEDGSPKSEKRIIGPIFSKKSKIKKRPRRSSSASSRKYPRIRGKASPTNESDINEGQLPKEEEFLPGKEAQFDFFYNSKATTSDSDVVHSVVFRSSGVQVILYPKLMMDLFSFFVKLHQEYEVATVHFDIAKSNAENFLTKGERGRGNTPVKILVDADTPLTSPTSLESSSRGRNDVQIECRINEIAVWVLQEPSVPQSPGIGISFSLQMQTLLYPHDNNKSNDKYALSLTATLGHLHVISVRSVPHVPSEVPWIIMEPLDITCTLTREPKSEKDSRFIYDLVLNLEPFYGKFSYRDLPLVLSLAKQVVYLQDRLASDLKRQSSNNMDSLSSVEASYFLRGNVTLNVNTSDFILVNNMFGQESPVLQLSIQPFIGTATLEEAFECNVVLSCAIEYHNLRLAMWEPLVEPWTCRFSCKKAENGKVSVELVSDTKLDINVTGAFLECISTAPRVWSWAHEKKTVVNQELCMHWIKNETGLKINCFGDEITSFEISTGERSPLAFGSIVLHPSRCISMDLSSKDRKWSSIQSVPFDRATGARSYRLDPLTALTPPLGCVVDVQVTQGRKIMTVYSTLMVENNTSVCLEISYRVNSFKWFATLKPEKSIAVPADIASMKGVLRVRPVSEREKYDFQPVRLLKGEKDNSIRFQAANGYNFFCSSVVTCSEKGKRLVSFHAPFRFENSLASKVNIRVTSKESRTLLKELEVDSGEKVLWHTTGWSTAIILSVRLPDMEWSSQIEVYLESDNEKYLTMSDGNGASLEVTALIEVLSGSCCSVCLYVPYWIVNRSHLPLLIEHDPSIKDKGVGILAGQVKGHVAKSEKTTSWGMTSPWKKTPPKKRRATRGHNLFPSVPVSRGLVELIPREEDAGDEHLGSVIHSSFTNRNLQRGQLRLSMIDDESNVSSDTWSSEVGMDMAGTTSQVEVVQAERAYCIGVAINFAKEPFARTRIVTFTPRYVLMNTLPNTLQVSQTSALDTHISIRPAEHIAYHWKNLSQKKERLLKVRFVAAGWLWSGGFRLEELGECALRLRNEHTHSVYLLRVSIQKEGPCVVIYFLPEAKENPPYRIENYSLATLRLHQLGVSAAAQVLLPHQTCDYTWDEPTRDKLSLIAETLVAGKRKLVGGYSLDQLQKFPPIRGLQVEVVADGPTRILRFRDELATEDSGSELSGALAPLPVLLEINVTLSGIGVSLCSSVDSHQIPPKELLYLWFQKLSWSLCRRETGAMSFDHIALSIGNIQMDNQLQNCHFPVLLSFPLRSEGESILQCMLVRQNNYAPGIEFYRTMTLQVLPIQMNLDWSLLSEVFLVGTEVQTFSHLQEEDLSSQEALESSLKLGIVDVNPAVLTRNTLAPAAMNIVPKAMEEQKVYIEELYVHPISANVSFSSGLPGSAIYDPMSHFRASSSSSSLRHMFLSLANSLARVEKAPLHLQALHYTHAFGPPVVLLDKLIATSYYRQLLGQAHVILGSADFLGNPIRVISNFKIGVKDFFYEPAQGLLTSSPTAFGAGMLRGTSSLLRNSAFGVLAFTSSVSSSVALGLTGVTLQLDTYTGYKPAQSFFEGFVQGLSGIVVSPVNGLEMGGIQGFGQGLTAGVVGSVLKPVAGMFTILSRTSTALRNSMETDTMMLCKRVRPPRYIDPLLQRLTPFSYTASIGDALLSRVLFGRFRSEGYVGHVELEDYRIALVTHKRLLVVQSKYHICPIEWEILLEDLVMTESSGNNSLIFYHMPSAVSFSIPQRKLTFTGLPEVHAMRSMLLECSKSTVTRIEHSFGWKNVASIVTD